MVSQKYWLLAVAFGVMDLEQGVGVHQWRVNGELQVLAPYRSLRFDGTNVLG